MAPPCLHVPPRLFMMSFYANKKKSLLLLINSFALLVFSSSSFSTFGPPTPPLITLPTPFILGAPLLWLLSLFSLFSLSPHGGFLSIQIFVFPSTNQPSTLKKPLSSESTCVSQRFGALRQAIIDGRLVREEEHSFSFRLPLFDRCSCSPLHSPNTPYLSPTPKKKRDGSHVVAWSEIESLPIPPATSHSSRCSWRSGYLRETSDTDRPLRKRYLPPLDK